MGAIAERSGDPLAGIASIVELMTGKKQSRTVTSSEAPAAGAMEAVVKGILENPSYGLAAINSADNAAGGYNSTTQQLLSNDLAARAAGEAAKLTKTSSQTIVDQTDPRLDAADALKTILGLQVGGSLFGDVLSGLFGGDDNTGLINQIGEQIAEAIGLKTQPGSKAGSSSGSTNTGGAVPGIVNGVIGGITGPNWNNGDPYTGYTTDQLDAFDPYNNMSDQEYQNFIDDNQQEAIDNFAPDDSGFVDYNPTDYSNDFADFIF